MNQAGMIVDCSHMRISQLRSDQSLKVPSYFLVMQILKPWVKHERNVSNEQLKAIALHDGVVCLNGVNLFLGEEEPSLNTFLDHVCYVAEYIGVEYVGIGLDISFKQNNINDNPKIDFDPTYWWPEMAEGLMELKRSATYL